MSNGEQGKSKRSEATVLASWVERTETAKSLNLSEILNKSGVTNYLPCDEKGQPCADLNQPVLVAARQLLETLVEKGRTPPMGYELAFTPKGHLVAALIRACERGEENGRTIYTLPNGQTARHAMIRDVAMDVADMFETVALARLEKLCASGVQVERSLGGIR
jgi:hypothetical protein